MLSSLRVQLLVLVLVAAMPIVVIVVLSAREQRRLLAVDAMRDTTALAQLVAERHQRSVDTARGLLLGITRMRAIRVQDGALCSSLLAPLLERERAFVNMGAVHADGRMFCSASPYAGAIDLSDRAFFREALRTGGLGVGEFVVSRVRGAGALGFAHPVEDDDGRVVAVAYASLAVAELQRELDDLELPPGAEVAVLDRGGVTISARPRGAAWAGRPFEPRLVAALRGARGPIELPGTDGTLRLFDLRDVTAPDGTVAMRVVAGLPTSALLDRVDRVAGRALLASLLASALALAAAVLVAELMLVRRIRRLVDASRQIAAGDWSARTGLARSRDELGRLVGSFDEMARSLEELDRERHRQEDQLRQAHKMEAIGRLAGGVAHDFNNLLTVILSAAAALRDRLAPRDPGQADALEIIASGERAAALTRKLLAFSRQQPIVPRVLDLGETARGMERMLARLLGEGITLSTKVTAPGRTRTDPGQIELALMNLAVNARDAMPGGGTLEVEVDEVGADDPRRPSGPDVPAGPLAVLTVRDDGVGMDEAVRRRIFEPFFTTKASGQGTGLGLSTVLGIVQQSGGAVRVESAPGEGTEVRLYLPGHTGAREEVARPPHPPAAAGTGRILLVEDDERLRAIVRRALAEAGHEVVAAAGAAEALAAARGLAGPPQLLLTDVILADGNGVDVARELSARWSGLPVLFMSGYAGEHLAALETIPGARFVPKPFTPDVLLAAIRDTLEVRRARSAARVTAS